VVIHLGNGEVLINGKLRRLAPRRDSYGRRYIRVNKTDVVVEQFDLPDGAPAMLRPGQGKRKEER